MSILKKLATVRKSSGKAAQVEMTPDQLARCKKMLKDTNRGPAVLANKFDMKMPFRVSTPPINGDSDSKWEAHGQFTSVDVAAAVGTLVSLSIFGEKAVSGEYDEAVVEEHAEFQAWLADDRNAAVIARVEAGTCLIGATSNDDPF